MSQKLDDFDSSDEEEEGSATFSVRELMPPRRYELPLSTLFRMLSEGEIDVNPPYQRAVVWPQQKQSLLIDSLFKNISVPPIVFAEVKDEEGVPIKICVDGKQRLTSIQRFMAGQLPYSLSKNKRFFFSSPDKQSRMLIPNEYKKRFEEKLIRCEEYTQLTAEMEHEIFRRVQEGMPLTAAEKLAAVNSPWQEYIADLEQRYIMNDGGLADTIDYESKRGRQFQNVAQLVFCCDGYPAAELSPTAMSLYKWLSRPDKPSGELKQAIEGVMQDYIELASDPTYKSTAFSGKRISPVEFVFIGVLLYVIRNRSHKDKSSSIQYLRKTAKKNTGDLRMNNRVTAGLWAIIQEIKDQASNQGPRRNKRPVDDDEYTPESNGSSSKRRR
ncbi:DUF262 domain-containing protein [Mycena kentingensis (nom. inval.)]|nr:DUF262 domain-containing protein [Mycena kentingensis (nom. inval.)]